MKNILIRLKEEWLSLPKKNKILFSIVLISSAAALLIILKCRCDFICSCEKIIG